MFVYVARQPIFDRRQKVYSYELLYRAGGDNYNPEQDGTLATTAVISNSFLTIGLDRLTRKKKAFINFTGRLLEEQTALLLPRELVAIEITDSTETAAASFAACENLKKNGYTLVLDGYNKEVAGSELLSLADMVKIDYRLTGEQERAALVAGLQGSRKQLIAKKVETVREYGDAMAAGYHYFQGYFFCEPSIISGKEIPTTKLHNLRLLQEIYKAEIDFDQVESLIKQDPSLSYKLLRFINSLAFSVRFPIRSIRQAMALLGQKEIIKWASLVALRNVAYDKPDELMVTAVSRARFCESMGMATGLEDRSADLFLTGLFSLLDTFLDQPMEEILAALPLADDIKSALLGKPGELRNILDLVLLYERGSWDQAFELAACEYALDEVEVMSFYLESLELADMAFR